jgi:hypothetical protein
VLCALTVLCWAVLCAVQAASVESAPAAAGGSALEPSLSAPLLIRHSSASSLTDMTVIPSSPVGLLLPTALHPSVLQPLTCWPDCPARVELCLRMLVPVSVLCVGLGFSIAALSVAFANMSK